MGTRSAVSPGWPRWNRNWNEEFRLVALDNRGHGRSEKPRDAYAEPELWANDVRAVIETLELDDPVLVGWSYGGLIISDYLATYGDDDIAGINLTGAITKYGTEDADAVIGQAFHELIPGFESTDVEESVEALKTVIERCIHSEIDEQDLYFVLGFNTLVPPYVREGLHSRTVTHDQDLREIDVPTLISHGEEDVIVLPDAAEEHAELIPDAETSFYPGVGHNAFWEDAERFNRELEEFVSSL